MAADERRAIIKIESIAVKSTNQARFARVLEGFGRRLVTLLSCLFELEEALYGGENSG